VSEAEKRLLLSAFACVFFGYSTINCLVFYRRTRRQAQEYQEKPFASFLHSPQFGPTLWITGVVGVVGFVVASWELVLSLIAMSHAH
jgi:hypothetical protein